MAKSFWDGIKGGFQKAASSYATSGSFGQAANSFWIYTTDYFLPNKQRFQVDGGRYGARYEALRTIEQAEEFAIAVNAISREVGASDWKVELNADKTLEPKIIDDVDAPVNVLLNRPNGLHSWQSWIETAIWILLPTGNLYILKDPLSMAGTPMALWILRSDRTQPIRDDFPTAPIQGYLHYAEDGRRYVFPPDRVIHIKLPNAYTDYQGLGMVQLLQQSLEMDFRSMESNIQMFRQGGRLSTVLEGLDEDADKLKEMKNKIIESHMGSENAHRVLLLTGNAKLNTQANGSQPKEADYKVTRESVSRNIGGMMGVPPMIMGILGDVNRATATVQQQLFLKNAIWPMMQRLTPAMNDIVKLFNPEFTFVWPRVDVMDPETMAVMMKNGLEGGALSPNDAREKFLQMTRVKDPAMDKHYVYGMQSVIEEGVGAIAQTKLAASIQAEQPKPAPAAPGAPKPADAVANTSPQPHIPAPPPGKLSKPPALTKKSVSSFPKGTKKQRRILDALKAARPKIEKEIAPIFEKHIKAFGSKAATAMLARHKGKAIGKKSIHPLIGSMLKAYDDSGTTAGIQSDAQDAYLVQIATAAQDASSIFEIDMSAFTEDSPEVADVALSLAQRVKWMDQTLKDKLAALIEEGGQLGLSPYEIANGTADGSFTGITKTFEGIAKEHAQLIARTEVAHLQDAINTEAYKKMGITMCDVIGCEDFVIMDGEIYGCNSQDVPVSALPINFHPNHNGAVVPQAGKEEKLPTIDYSTGENIPLED
jgi:HK97 family phage portal protein